MIELLKALAWMRWRAFVHAISRRRKGSEASRWSALLSAASQGVVTTFGIILAILLATGGFAIGIALTKGGETGAGMGIAVRVLGLMSLLMAVVSPLQAGAEGRVPARLMLVPVPLRRLHAASILASALDPMVILILPAMFTVLLGMAAAGHAAAALTALPAALALAAFVVGFDALVGFGMQLLLRDRRRGEMGALIILVVVMVLGFLPALLATRLESGARETTGAAGRAEAVTSAHDVERSFGPVDLLPPGLYARALQRGLDGRPGSALAHAGVLAIVAAACLSAATAAHARLLREPGRTSRRSSRGAFPRHALRLPLVRPATMAVASACVRTTLRTVRGKIATFTPPLAAGVLALVFRRAGDVADTFASSLVTSTGLLSWSVALTLLNLQPFMLNAHATDRSGFTLFALQPATAQEIVRGKMLGFGALLAMGLVPALAVAVSVGSPAPARAWLTTVLAIGAAWLLHAPVALLLSALFPKPADMTKLGGQQPHGAAALLGALSVLFAMLLPRLAGFAGLLVAPWAQVAATALMVALAAAAAPLATALGASLLQERREAVSLAAQGR